MSSRTQAWFTALALSCACACLCTSAASAQKKGKRAKSEAAQEADMPPSPPPASAPAATPAEPAPEPASAAPSGLSIQPATEPATQVSADKPVEPPPAVDETKVEEARAVREELSTVMDTLVSARARAALLGKSLFKTRVRVLLENEAAEDQALGKVALFLDGNPIFRGEGSALNPEGAKLFEGYAAPGPHVLTIEIEQRSRADDGYSYTQTSALRFTVLREKLTALKLVLDDDSDIAEDFQDDEEGEYDVRLRLEVEALPLGGS